MAKGKGLGRKDSLWQFLQGAGSPFFECKGFLIKTATVDARNIRPIQFRIDLAAIKDDTDCQLE
ncbi:hypothetical protein M5E89_03485 [Acidaminococcus intestini]|nr:hypothetical protein M5E89_03485 [Acidaminococcus intestini]